MPITALRLSLFFFCLLFAVRGPAQTPLIVKDYTNCTVGLQDKSGRWIAEPVYMHIDPFIGNFAIVQKNNLHGLINKDGREVIKAEWNTIQPLYGVPAARRNLFIVTNGAFSTSVIDTNGTVILSCNYRFVDHFRDSAVLAYDKWNTWTFVHLNGTIATAPASTIQPLWIAPHCYLFKQVATIETENMPGYAAQKMMEGVVHTSGKIIIPPRYEKVEWLSIRYPMFQVRNGIYTGYYTLHGEQLWDCTFTDVQDINGGYHQNLSAGPCFARYKNKWGLMDVDGDALLPFAYDVKPRAIIYGTYPQCDTAYIINVDSSFGILRGGNDWLLEPVYQAIIPLYGSYSGLPLDGYYCCSKNGKWGCITSAGEEIVPVIYDTVYGLYGGAILFWSPGDAGLIQYTQSYAQVGLTEEQFYAQPKDTTRDPNVYYSEDVPKWYYGPEYDYNSAWEDYWWTLYPEDDVDEKMKGAVNPYPYILSYPPVSHLTYSRLDTVPGNKKGFTTYLQHSRQEYSEDYQTEPALVVEKDSAGNIFFHTPQRAQNSLYIISGHTEGLLAADGRVIVAPGTYRYFNPITNGYTAFDTTGQL
ncbi:MAG TPA: WG repeat-containing protein, partial [Bacteroidia bacterium]|nr:WG repeat-containing protein [Bacteroidia bacterium]